jgi:endogenous inhibitor of DNA gyrase (YacG/DUF329 family)
MRAKCPECEVYADFRPVGPYRKRCPICGALVKNEELTEEKEEPDARTR